MPPTVARGTWRKTQYLEAKREEMSGGVEVHIIGAPKEIAALVAALQERQDLQQAKDVANQIADMLTETASSVVDKKLATPEPWVP